MSVDQNPAKPVSPNSIAVKPQIIKDAELVSSPRDDAPPKIKPITFGQQVFIWAMILLVGVIFGVGSSWTFLQQPQRSIEGVSENDLLVRKSAADRLQRILAASNERFALGSMEAYAQTLRLSRVAAAEGLLPEGADLDRVTNEFLARTISAAPATPGASETPGRTYRALLLEHQGARDEVTRLELRRLLAERTAIDALYARNVAAPAVATSVSAAIDQLRGTHLTASEVVLDAKHLLPDVKADDPEVQTTYEKVRATRFTRRAQVTAMVAAADLNALAAKQVIGDAEIAAAYEQRKETYRKPAPVPVPPAVADPAAPPVYQPLAEVAAEIKAKLARTAAEQAAQVAIQAFNSQVDEKGLEQGDGAAFAAAASAAGLVVTPALVIDEPNGGQVDLGPFGMIKDPAGLFSKEPGFITNPLQAAGAADASDATEAPSANVGRTWFVLRVMQKTPAGIRTLDEVRSEVQGLVAGARAYQALLSEAEKLRAAAEAAGPGGLALVMANPANAVWAATVSEDQMRLLEELHAPASEAGGAVGDIRLATSLVLPVRPVVVCSVERKNAGAKAPAAAVTPQVRLIQISQVRHDELPPSPVADSAGMYRNALSRYQQTQFDRILREKLGK